jgi:protein-S-isoprenylcysteine O-methyltransferase Ste14
VRRGSAARAAALAKTLVFTVLVPGTVAGFVPWTVLRGPAEVHTDPLGLAGMLVMAIGIAGYALTALAFALVGLGTPAPIDPPKALVVRGLHRHVRNPMYLAVLTVVGGDALVLRSLAVLLYAAVLAFVFHVVVIAYEEPALQRQFGEGYARYRRSTPRWWPRWGRG